MRGPRVLVLVENNSAPSDRRVWAESRSLVEAGYSVTIVCPTGRTKDTASYESVDGVEIHRYRPREARRAPWGYAIEYGSAIRQMRKIVRRLVVVGGPFDVVHICNPPDILIWAVRFLRTSGAAIVFDHHDLVPELYTVRFGDGLFGLPNRLARFFERRILQAADVVVAPNESYKRIAVERGGKRAEDVFVVRIAPDLERFRPTDPDPTLKRGKPYLLVYAGTMGYQDGVDRALAALERLSRKRLDWHAAFAGSGDAVAEMRRRVFELGLDGAVEFVGHLEDAALLNVLSTADVCLSPEPPERPQQRLDHDQGHRVPVSRQAGRRLRPSRDSLHGRRRGALRRLRRRPVLCRLRRPPPRRCAAARRARGARPRPTRARAPLVAFPPAASRGVRAGASTTRDQRLKHRVPGGISIMSN